MVQQINNAIDKPSQIIKIIGAALPASSNFFIGASLLKCMAFLVHITACYSSDVYALVSCHEFAVPIHD